MLWIITQEDSEEVHRDIFERYGALFKTYASVDPYVIRGTGVELPGEVVHKEEVMAQADTMASALCS